MTSAAKSPYAGYRFPGEIISHAVWLYFRFRRDRSGISLRVAGLACLVRDQSQSS
jgi:transposase-like protein